MTNQEYLEKIREQISKEIIRDSRFGSAENEAIYLDRSMIYLKRLYSGFTLSEVPAKFYFPWHRKDLAAINVIWENIKPQLEKFVSAKLKKMKSAIMIQEINELSTSAKISEVMKQNGFQYYIQAQVHRIRMTVKVGPKNKATFYIRYKKTDEDLGTALTGIRALISLIGSLDTKSSIENIKGWERWTNI